MSLEDYDDDLAAIVRCSNKSTVNDDESGENEERITTTASPPISSVNRDDLHRISLVGSGQFCNVHFVSGSLPQHSQCAIQDKSLHKRSLYAFKSIDMNRVSDSDELIMAATDLANEAKILSRLDHKNIIRLRGLCAERFSQSFLTGEGYFLVLDVLKETLSDRLHHWRKHDKDNKHTKNRSIRVPMWLKSRFQKPSSSERDMTVRKQKKQSRQGASSFIMNADDCQRQMMYNRIEDIVFGIAEGMEYLHSQNIVLRDLNPNNIGFDYETGTIVQLFDFGMARNINDCNPDVICGSPRYMAPEVMAGNGYSLKVDAYSFGVLLFELCSLCVPYAANYWNKKKYKNRYSQQSNRLFSWYKNLSSIANSENKTHNNSNHKTTLLEGFYTSVIKHQLRPADDLKNTIPCTKMRALIQECWITNPDHRPTFKEILSTLTTILNRQKISS